MGFVTGLAVALWSANAGMKGIIDALNVVYDEKEKRSFVKLNLLSLLFTAIAILSLMIALAAVVIAPIVFSAVGLSSLLSLAIAVLRWPLLLVLAAIALAAIYRWAKPHRGALAMAFGRQRRRGRRVADRLGALLMVHRPFWRV
jgi:membrane protein